MFKALGSVVFVFGQAQVTDSIFSNDWHKTGTEERDHVTNHKADEI